MIDRLHLPPRYANALAAQARAAAPEEMCGVLGGIIQGETALLTDCIAVPNRAAQPQRAFYLDERGLAAALYQLERSQRALLGFYHSHPNGDPIPSDADTHAAYPDTIALIIGLKDDARFAAWSLAGGRALPVEVVLADTLYLPEAGPARQPLSRSAQAAIVIAALVGMLLVLLTAVLLLPPAPPVPVP